MVKVIIDESIEKLVRLTGSINELMYLSVEPEICSIKLDCFKNVEKKIDKDGGNMVLGWQIWMTKHIFEAEFHAVWKSNTGVFKDITPKNIDIKQILFLPDENRKYEGKQIDNIRLNITNNALVDDFIEICKAIFYIENKGERAYKYDDLNYTGTEKMQLTVLRKWKDVIELNIKIGGTVNSICFFCKSKKEYKNCCGNGLKNRLQRIK